MQTKIKKITAREILDSRGNPTVEAEVVLENGLTGIAAVPSGASTGIHEAWELRDGTIRYGGKGVLKAIKNIDTIISPLLSGHDVFDQRGIDGMMIKADGTANKKNFGANAILAVSLAVARAGAITSGLPLYAYLRQAFQLQESGWRMPVPTMNIINGGRHSDNGLTIQEFMIIPIAKKFAERVRMGSQIFHSLAAILSRKGLGTGVGDEGGYAPEIMNNEQAIKLIMEAILASKFEPGKNVFLGIDFAASEFYRKGNYYFMSKKQASRPDKMIRSIEELVKKYPIMSIEDPLAEDDWDNWRELTQRLGKKTVIVGDDLFVTNTERIKQGIAQKVANAVLIKLNQIGSLSETMEAIYLARQHGYKVSISHRSGETADTFIADLAVAVNAEFIKSGSLSRSERVEKYNRLMKIEMEVGG